MSESEEDTTDDEHVNNARSDETDISGKGTGNENEANNFILDKMYPISKESCMDLEQTQNERKFEFEENISTPEDDNGGDLSNKILKLNEEESVKNQKENEEIERKVKNI